MMNKLQSKLLEMFTWLTGYLHEHELRYYMIEGTMLGAARHGGFIPWDDDIDIGMPRKDYNILIGLLKEPTKDGYVVEAPSGDAKDFLYPFAKFYDTKTTLVEKLRHNVKRGIYIDIFPLDGIGESIEESLSNYKAIDRLNMILAMKTSRWRKDRVWWKNAAVVIGTVIPVSAKKLTSKIDLLCSSRDFDKSRFSSNLISTYRGREIMERTIYGEPTFFDFEGIRVCGIEHYDEYLTKLYGDWRKLPPEDKRHSAHDFAELKYEESYLSKNNNK